MVTKEHRSAFQEIKAEFAKEILLAYFSTEKKCTLQIDASKKGFGPVLLQDENLVYYASQSLSNAEKNYQICRENVWQEIKDVDKETEILAVNIISSFTLQQAEIDDLQKATSEDTELQCLNDWPAQRSSCSDTLKNYWNYRDELWIEYGILMKNHKILIPKVLQGKYLKKIHARHQGINSCLQRAREYIFWNGYTKDIQETVEKCGLCQENASSTQVHVRCSSTHLAYSRQ